MKKNLIILQFLIFFNGFTTLGQFVQKQPDCANPKYWIVFKDKPTPKVSSVSPQTLQNRIQLGLPVTQWTDFPLNSAYLNILKSLHIDALQQSKWLNAVSASMNLTQVESVKQLDFVQEVRLITHLLAPSFHQNTQQNHLIYSALEQMRAEEFTKNGLTGKNVAIGILDVGFEDAHTHPDLQHIFLNRQLIQIKDFITPHTKHFFRKKTAQDWHGREVWLHLAGKNNATQAIKGLAVNAQFYLARTDHGVLENRAEEDNWIAAIEWLDSLGVRLVNSSLGYAENFDNPTENYSPKDMNGQTTFISQVAQIASTEKGMILVVSAGNEGENTDWQVITAPADAPSVITVGSTQSSNRSKVYYSSIGNEQVSFIKPDVSCYADLGTSFSAPVITSVIACILEKKPYLKVEEIHLLLKKSAHLYPFPNNFLGYGVPQADKILQYLQDFVSNPSHFEIIEIDATSCEIGQISQNIQLIPIFHKKNIQIVSRQMVLKPINGKILITKEPNVSHTTVDLGDKIVEIIWK